MLVSDCDDEDLLLPSPIDDAEGKALNESLPKSTCQRCARIRRADDALCSLLGRRQEALTKSLEVRFIEAGRRIEFRPSRRVELDLDHDDNFARSRAKTSRAGIPRTTPSRSS